MANYYATCRSSYYAVKDEEAYLEWISRFDVETFTRKGDDGTTMHGWVSADESGGMPQFWGEDYELDEPEDLIDGLAEHLADNHVAIAVEAGAESARYVCGHAWAVMPGRPVQFIDLVTAIMSLAYAEFGDSINATSPEY